jgi:hypothetical protein
MAPDLQAGLEYCKPVRSPNEFKAADVLDKVKNKTVRAGEKVYETSSKAFNSIQEKFKSGEVKEGAKHVG